MRFPLKDPMFVFARVRGRNGFVRELRAILDFNSPYCVLLSKDGLSLGYQEAALRPRDWRKNHPDMSPAILNFRGLERSIQVNLAEVSLGNIVAKDVGAVILELDLYRLLPFELILGRSFLDNFTLTLDARKGHLSLRELRPNPKPR
ncbi:MAG: hypothetical protein ABSA72_05260 [Nitrososphaerales archaeon]|jgi:hypothetical protein